MKLIGAVWLKRASRMKINLDQVSAEQKLWLTKVRKDLFLMLINPIAPKLTVPKGAQLYSDTLKQTIKKRLQFWFWGRI